MPVADWDDNPRVQNGLRRMLALRDERIAAGERPIGWKLGFGAPASLERFGLSAPLLGFLTDAGVRASGDEVSSIGWQNGVAEPEIAVHIEDDAEPGNVAGAIGALGPAIELADVHPPSDDIAQILAGNIYHKAVILGTPDASRAGGRLEGLRARVLHNGVEVADTIDLEAQTGDLVAVVGHAAALLASAGERLAPGDVVIAGSIVPPLPIAPGDEVVFELVPLPAISVSV
jgi:2-keto-4-pentenoate hydratase